MSRRWVVGYRDRTGQGFITCPGVPLKQKDVDRQENNNG